MSLEMSNEINKLNWVSEAVKDGPGKEVNQWTARGLSGIIVDISNPYHEVISLRNFEINLRKALEHGSQVAALNVILGGMAGLVVCGDTRPADLLEMYAPKIGLTGDEAKSALTKINKPAIQNLIELSGNHLGML